MTPADARLLAEKPRRRSPAAVTFLKVSNNGYGEVLTKAMGRKTQGKGIGPPACRRSASLCKAGIAAGAYRQVDGSGLSRMNQITAQQLTTLLLAAKQPWFAARYNALPIAGQPGLLVGGTLQSRMVKTAAAGRAHAKSGSMTGVSSLSGYVDSATGRPLAFAIISNNYLVPGAEVKALEDRRSRRWRPVTPRWCAAERAASVAFGDVGEAAGQQAAQIGGGQLDVQPAFAAGNVDGGERLRRAVDHRRQPFFCPSGLMPPTRYPVTRCASCGSAISAFGTEGAGDLFQIQLGGDRRDRHRRCLASPFSATSKVL